MEIFGGLAPRQHLLESRGSSCAPSTPAPDRSTSQAQRHTGSCSIISGLQKEVREVRASLIDGLREKGHQVDTVEFTDGDELVPIYYLLTTAEASSVWPGSMESER